VRDSFDASLTRTRRIIVGVKVVREAVDAGEVRKVGLLQVGRYGWRRGRWVTRCGSRDRVNEARPAGVGEWRWRVDGSSENAGTGPSRVLNRRAARERLTGMDESLQGGSGAVAATDGARLRRQSWECTLLAEQRPGDKQNG
jgi:hypothetical protein